MNNDDDHNPNNNNNNNNHNPNLNFRPPSPPSPPPPTPFQPLLLFPNAVVSNPTPISFAASSSSTPLNIPNTNAPPPPPPPQQQQQLQLQQQPNPSRKKRSKVTRSDADDDADEPDKKRPKKPDPGAPMITTPCSECGRRFWSWKALFGHMRCHPERLWRGIRPPPDFQGEASTSSNPVQHQQPPAESSMSEDEHDAASSLLILAGGPDQTTTQVLLPGTSSGCRENDSGGCRFECSSCKKVFGSHQALGGHRASHKNVKGCFAITRSDVEVEDQHQHQLEHHEHGNVVVEAGPSNQGVDDGNGDEVVESGHQCSICWRVFSSGQALGGHKRCHWERGEEASVVMTQVGMSSNVNPGGLDLNFPASHASTSAAATASTSAAATASTSAAATAAVATAPASEDELCSSSSSSDLGLDLRLGL